MRGPTDGRGTGKELGKTPEVWILAFLRRWRKGLAAPDRMVDVYFKWQRMSSGAIGETGNYLFLCIKSMQLIVLDGRINEAFGGPPLKILVCRIL